MQLVRKLFAADWNKGTYGASTFFSSPPRPPLLTFLVEGGEGGNAASTSSTRLDGQVNVDAYNHPAVVPNLDITSTDNGSGAALYGAATGGAQVTGFTSPSVSASSDLYANDQFVITRNPNAYLQFTSTADQVTINLAGYLAAGMHAQAGTNRLHLRELRNGAIVNVYVDGSLVASVDTYQNNPVVQIETGGGSHTVKIQHSGGYNTNLNPIGVTTPLVTGGAHNTIVQTLAVTPQYHPALVAASWRCVALSSSSYDLYQTIPGGSETLFFGQCATPGAPTIGVVGTAGTTTDQYQIVARNQIGATLASATGQTTTANATLNSTNYNTISWTAISGATSYDVLKWNGTAWALLVNTTALSVNDQGQATSAYTVPTSNTTAPQAGTTYSTIIPGCNLLVNTNVSLTTNDSATFTTDVTTMAIQQVTLGFGAQNGGGIYTSEVIDSGATDTVWVLAEWEENEAMSSFTLYTGNTPAPDASWRSYTVTPGDAILPSGLEMGFAGLIAAPRGQYAQWSIAMPAVTTKQVYIRNFYLYYWVPERDPNFVSKLALANKWTMGPILHALAASLGVALARCRQDAIDFVNSFAISGAMDQYLYAYLADFGITPYTGMPPEAARRFALAALQSKSQGGSLPFMVQQVALLVTGSLGSGVNTSGVSGSVTATCNGVTVTQISNQGLSWVIPAPPYAGLPGIDPLTAQALIKAFITGILTPANAVVTPNNTGSNISFN